MEILVIQSGSKSNVRLLSALARKLGDKVFNSIEEAEEAVDMALLNKMKKNRKGRLLSEREKSDFLEDLKQIAAS